MAAGVFGHSAAYLRLRFARDVVVPYLPCRWSHIGAKRRITEGSCKLLLGISGCDCHVFVRSRNYRDVRQRTSREKGDS